MIINTNSPSFRDGFWFGYEQLMRRMARTTDKDHLGTVSYAHGDEAIVLALSGTNKLRNDWSAGYVHAVCVVAQHRTNMIELRCKLRDEALPKCWCGRSAPFVNPITDASPATPVCAKHTADGYRVA